MAKPSTEEFLAEATEAETAAMIKDTNQEIFDDAVSVAPDENDGDRSLEEMDDDEFPGEEEVEGQQEEEVEAAAEEVVENTEDQQEIDPQVGDLQFRIPPARLKAEADARRMAEAERDAAQARAREFEARLAALERGNRQEPKAEKPDLFADPDGYTRQLREEIRQEQQQRHVNASLAEAAEEHGEAFREAYGALTSLNPNDPTARAAVQRIIEAPNPGRAIMKWHGEQKLLREVGSDPVAYRERLRQELMGDPTFRKQVIDELRGQARPTSGEGAPPPRRGPPSLNGAMGGGRGTRHDADLYNNSEDSVFAFATRN